ncbi:MAG: tetratricopeptide repeat protein [Pyrinomonadaceae bacterium]|nr:tetratricopeptide repeat protein [Sphingobacteriaceae bacterium]
MKLRYTLTGLLLLHFLVSFPQKNPYSIDSILIDKIIKDGYELRLSDPDKTIRLGKKAFDIAEKGGYKYELAESSRIMGIGYYNIDKTDSSIVRYLYSLSLFKELGNIEGQAKVYNNIGNLYREVDYKTGLKYFEKSLKMAIQANLTELVAGIYLNIGIIYHRKELFAKAIQNFEKSLEIFKKNKNETGVILSLQNTGVVYYALKKISKSEELLTEANIRAKKNNLNKVVASINLTLSEIYIYKSDFAKAEAARDEGILYSRRAKNKKIENAYLSTSYELEKKRGNYKQALYYMREVYVADSSDFDNAKSEQLKLSEAQFKFLQKEKENQIIIERQKKNKILLIGAIAVSILAFIVIFLLVLIVKKKNHTNKQLQLLNEEISLQKENLNQINQNLEAIIDERTKDLKIKNRKLAEYSSHLSHQIRGPIATMKGLMILETENLIDQKEFIDEVSKCVNEIDDKIININDVLHNLQMPGLIPKPVDKESKS